MRLSEYKTMVNGEFLPPESLILAVEPFLGDPPLQTRRGRPSKPGWTMFVAIYYVLRSGCQWKALPKCLGASSTVHDRFQKWVQTGVFRSLWEHGLLQAYLEGTLDFSWISADGCSTKSPLGGEQTGPNPTDRAKKGTKRHMMTETGGLPISLAVTGANVPDVTQVEQLFENLAIELPWPADDEEQHFCADKGYDAGAVRRLVARQGLQDNILSRGHEQQKLKIPGYRARRWVCERTHSWMNRFRRILIRWEKKVDNYIALLQLCCASFVWKRCRFFG